MSLTLPSELDRLASELMEYAREALSKGGEVYPIGAGITPDLELQWCAVDDTDDELTATEELDNLVQGMAGDAKSGKFIGAGILCTARITPPGWERKVDAVELRLDHKSGASLRVYIPYEAGQGGISFYAMFTSEGDSVMFHQGLVRIQ